MCVRLVPSYVSPSLSPYSEQHYGGGGRSKCTRGRSDWFVLITISEQHYGGGGRSMCTWGRSAGVQSTATATPPPLPWSSKLSHRTYYHFDQNHLTTWSNILPAHFRPQVTLYIYIWQDTWMRLQFWELETFKTWELWIKQVKITIWSQDTQKLS